MICTLMHKTIPVAELELDDVVCVISAIKKIYNAEHLPVGVHIVNGLTDRGQLNAWWRKRSIPASRDGLVDALSSLQVDLPESLISKCYGLSLSDQYWICPENSLLQWDKINFFENDFSEDVGNILLGHPASENDINFVSPDNTSDGWLKKKWSIINGKRFLLKGGSNIYRQEPYNEVIADLIMKKLGIEHTEYTVKKIGDEPFSVCENFVTKNTELVSANHILQSKKQPNNSSLYSHFVNICNDFGLDAVNYLNKLLTVDFIIANTDRHTNNFGLIRNAQTLEYVGFAPAFDNGTSLWYNVETSHIQPISPKTESKPFKDTHYEQIKLVSDFDWLDFSSLDNIENEVYSILSLSEIYDENRLLAVSGGVKQRIELLKEFINKKG